MITVFFAAITAILLEGTITYGVMSGLLSFLWALAVHVVTVGAFISYVYLCHKNGNDLKLPILLAALTAVSGVLGALLCAVVMLLYAWFQKTAIPFDIWLASIFPEEDAKESEHTYERILSGLDNTSEKVEVEPFQDILSYGTLAQKQMVIVKIGRYFRSGFAPHLLLALRDTDNAVRVQAATAIAKIEREFMEQSLMLEQALVHDPDNVGTMQKLAQLCEEYSSSGLLDAGRAKQAREKAIRLYEYCFRLRPQDSFLQLTLARLHLHMGDTAKAYCWIKGLIGQEYAAPSSQEIELYMHILFQLRAYAMMRDAAGRYEGKKWGMWRSKCHPERNGVEPKDLHLIALA